MINAASSFAETTRGNAQPYKYNGKELDEMHGLNLYDYSARYYESAIGRFTTVDPMAEKYYSISPYVYCNNNLLRFIDPTGMSYTYNWDTNEYEYSDSDGDGDGNKRKAEWNEVRRDIDKDLNEISTLTSIKGIMNERAEFVMNLFFNKIRQNAP